MQGVVRTIFFKGDIPKVSWTVNEIAIIVFQTSSFLVPINVAAKKSQ